MLSNIGTQVHDVATALLMTTVLSATPTQVALIATATSLPVLLLALPAGALADVASRRRIMLAGQGALAVAAALLGVLTVAGQASVPLLLAVTFLMGLASAAQSPAASAVVPELVPPDELPQALALSGVSFNLSRIVGPAVGAVLVATAGAGTAYLVNAASFVVVALAFQRWREVRTATPLPPEHVADAVRVGPRFVRHDPGMRAVLLRTGAFMLTASAPLALLPVIATDRLAGGAGTYGTLVAALGAGGVVGAAALPRLRDRWGRERAIAAATLVLAGSAAVLGQAGSVAVAATAMLVLGTGWLVCLVSFSSAAQLAVPAWVRGRTSSVFLVVLMGANAVSAPLWGALTTRAGLGTALAVSAAAAAMTTPLALRWRLPDAASSATATEITSAWDEPPVLSRPAHGDGPAVISHTYRLARRADAGDLVDAAALLREARLRDGCLRWSLLRDTGEPLLWREQYVVPSFHEHLRQRERHTADVHALETRVRALLADPAPLVSHELLGGRRLRRLLSAEELPADAVVPAQGGG